MFTRVDAENAPRISVISENTLDDISSGKLSLFNVISPHTDVPNYVSFPNNINIVTTPAGSSSAM